MPGEPTGGLFLLEKSGEREAFTPEDLTEEQRQFAKLQLDFSMNEVLPKKEEIEHKNYQVTFDLMKKAGELGLLMADIPEEYGGMGVDKVTTVAMGENAIILGSFGVTIMCNTGIAVWPIVYYGNDAQKKKYLPKIAAGEWISAYALTEPNSGSDALSLRTKAVLSPDGKHYILNGEKTFITNGGFSQCNVVYTKTEGDKVTAFIVDKGTPGFSSGAEEKKLGLKGSSTTSLIFEDAKVPVENLLGEVGKGHKIAFNILNLGRFKLGVGAAGGAKYVLKKAIEYTKERKQFGKPICEFGLIQKKITDMAIGIFLCEGINYRTAGMMDERLKKLDKHAPDYSEKNLQIVEDFAVEASISKVYGSELLHASVDEGLQALGGYGFLEEYPMEIIYRDQRVNRIFEGTNEINRMLIPGTLFKRAMKGQLDLMGEIGRIVGSLKEGFPKDGTGPLADQIHQANLAKKLAVYCSGVAAQKFMDKLQEKQYFLEAMANLTIEAYVFDSAINRTLKLIKSAGEDKSKVATAIVKTYFAEKYPMMINWARQMLANVAGGNAEEFGKYAKALSRFEYYVPVDVPAERAVIAERILDRGEYNVV